MDVEVIVPCTRPALLPRLLRSFAQQAVPPARVTVVTNHELVMAAPPGLSVRQLSFTSDRLAIGRGDVCLRRDIGLWWARSSTVLFFDDDQLAPGNLIMSLPAVFDSFKTTSVWGNYRYVDWTEWTDQEVRDNLPSVGRAREKPGGHHRVQSCYGGLFAAHAEMLRATGGFDLVYTSSDEDQAMGMRLLGINTAVLIHEPPFAWHTTQRLTREPCPRSNVCSTCELEVRLSSEHGSFRWLACKRCPFVGPAPGQGPVPVGPIVPFDPAHVTVTETALS
jgi:hypothetical protein